MRLRAMVGLVAGLASTVLGSAAQAAVGGPSTLQVAADAPAVTKVEYFCSPGFEPSYGGTCIAVPSRAEIELFVDQPIYETDHEMRRVVRHRRHHGLRERY